MLELPVPMNAHKKTQPKLGFFLILVPVIGLEPTRHLCQRILSPPRLPFRHTGNTGRLYRRRDGFAFHRVQAQGASATAIPTVALGLERSAGAHFFLVNV